MIEFRPIPGGDVSRQDRQRTPEAAPSPCRALVAISPAAPRETLRPAPASRASAPFLAQLIATAEGLPQTREKRRIEPDQASCIYATAQAGKPARAVRLALL